MESPNEMVDLINTLISECLDRHAPLKRVKITRLPAPWLHAADIRQLQAEREKPRLDEKMRIMMNHGLLSGLSLKRLR